MREPEHGPARAPKASPSSISAVPAGSRARPFLPFARTGAGDAGSRAIDALLPTFDAAGRRLGAPAPERMAADDGDLRGTARRCIDELPDPYRAVHPPEERPRGGDQGYGIRVPLGLREEGVG